jgi:hypothetical protein
MAETSLTIPIALWMSLAGLSMEFSNISKNQQTTTRNKSSQQLGSECLGVASKSVTLSILTI